MAGGDEFLNMGKANRDALSAILFLAGSTNAFDAYSTLNSSPWTAESFGGDPAKAASCREYLYHAIGITMAYGLAASFIAESPYPLAGTVIIDIYLYWLYNRALNRAVARKSTGWHT
ncbi:MAG: hypothetical protein ABSF18_07700 [Gammaproteobacteria bacterium]|jgi:hypothetical protein